MNDNLVSVVKILEVSFAINERLFKPNIEAIVTINQESEYKISEKLYSLTIRAHFEYDGTEQKILQIGVQNVFKVTGLNEFFNPETKVVSMPSHILLTVLGLSLSHTRALLSKNTKGTAYNDLFLPIMNPVEVAKVIFPEMFKEVEAI